MPSADTIRDEWLTTLRQFRDGNTLGMNLPVHLDNGIVVMLAHWSQNKDELEVVLSLPKWSVQPDDPGQSFRSLGEEFEEVADIVDTVLSEAGYEPPSSYVYDTDFKDGRSQTWFVGYVDNPCS